MHYIKITRRRLAGHGAIALTLALLVGTPAQAEIDRAQLREAGGVAGSVFASLVYTPLKLAYATTGSVVGGLSWVFSGGQGRVARPVLDRALGGDWWVEPDHLRDPLSLAFVGDARDQASAQALEARELPAVSAAPSSSCLYAASPVIYFGSGETEIGSDSLSTLQGVAQTMRACPELRFDIAAHADASGDPQTNRRLSEARANAVHRHLVGEGIEATRFSVRSYGGDQPVATNNSFAGRAQNRRVELFPH